MPSPGTPEFDRLVSLASLMFGVLGVLLASLFYLRARRRKQLCWSERKLHIIDGSLSKLRSLTVQYAGRPVNDLWITRIALWSDGQETIDGLDLRTANPLRIIGVTSTRFLDANVVATNTVSCGLAVSVAADQLSVGIDFSYLDQGHGGVIELIHADSTSDGLWVVGDVKGARPARYRVLYRPTGPTALLGRHVPRFVRRLYGFAGYLAAAVLFLVLAWVNFFVVPSRTSPWIDYVISGMLVVGSMATGTLGWWAWAERPPRGLSALDEDML